MRCRCFGLFFCRFFFFLRPRFSWPLVSRTQKIRSVFLFFFCYLLSLSLLDSFANLSLPTNTEGLAVQLPQVIRTKRNITLSFLLQTQTNTSRGGWGGVRKNNNWYSFHFPDPPSPELQVSYPPPLHWVFKRNTPHHLFMSQHTNKRMVPSFPHGLFFYLFRFPSSFTSYAALASSHSLSQQSSICYPLVHHPLSPPPPPFFPLLLVALR